MTAPAQAEKATTQASESTQSKAARKDIRHYLTRSPVFVTVIVICVLWSMPTLGVLMSSFRSEREINTSGWWAVFAPSRDNPDYTTLKNQIDDRQAALDGAEADLAELQTTLATAQETLDADFDTAVSNVETDLLEVQAALADIEGTDDAQAEIQSALDNLDKVPDAQTAISTAEEVYAESQTAEVEESVTNTTAALETTLATVREARDTIDLEATTTNIRSLVAEAIVPLQTEIENVTELREAVAVDDATANLVAGLGVVQPLVEAELENVVEAREAIDTEAALENLSATLENIEPPQIEQTDLEQMQQSVGELQTANSLEADAIQLEATLALIEKILGDIEFGPIRATTIQTDIDTLTQNLADLGLAVPEDTAAEIQDGLDVYLLAHGYDERLDTLGDAQEALKEIDNSAEIGPSRARDAQVALQEVREQAADFEQVEIPEATLTSMEENIALLFAVARMDDAISELVDAQEELSDRIWGIEDTADYVEDAREFLESAVRTDEALAALANVEETMAPALAQAQARAALLEAKEGLADIVDDAADDVEDAQETLADIEGTGEVSDALAATHTQLETLTAVTELEAETFETEGRIDRTQVRLENDEQILEDSGEPENIVFGSRKWREQWTLDNYEAVVEADNMDTAFLNSLVVTIPSVVIPITLAAFAAYAFAWLTFPGRNLFFAIVVILMVVPLHTALIPILRIYLDLELNGTYLGIWLAHTGFGMPLAIYLLYGYISTIPREIMESAKVDGASPFTTFTRLIVPLSVPAIASFAIFQFLWVWNDLLVALVFLGTKEENRVLTRNLSEMVGSKGQDWEVLTAGAFISMSVPLLVFFALQRYFVRGLMAGSVKG